MKITGFIKKELEGWKNFEIIGVGIVFAIVLTNAFVLKDSPMAVMNALCGVLYTIIAGKGKISCYFFGLIASTCYIILACKNALWGNMLFQLCYCIPMQILGIFKWKQHLKSDTQEIVKIKLPSKERLQLALVGIFGSLVTIAILYYTHDKAPIIDGITTFLSILAMYLTVRRAIEQWMVWTVVNGLSVVMWVNLVMHGAKAYSTVVTWSAYSILAIYFWIIWSRELKNK